MEDPRRERHHGRRDGHRAHISSRRAYYWVCAVDKVSGRPVIAGPHDSSGDADQWGFEHIKDGDFKVHEFNTRDKTAARDMFKHILLEQSGQLADVLRRAKYKVA